ncbi:extracellular solute-binding protein [Solirubrobacter sp. CPCC 204708]|uniref:Extracellular solute-binding protein n=1 Tax=Solirubrobacter deserti TaxID=2282478 RepID=A0ABT4RQV0_9ACTN|nr:extracellular solute-binding protein [Solirubrobacter deserti]MBE2320724.1 extracellular solute-binding protein [Solirubrobacter deserti]MDA0140948.1 extracellular solute-binding protein [Solirubrobacter deserti]
MWHRRTKAVFGSTAVVGVMVALWVALGQSSGAHERGTVTLTVGVTRSTALAGLAEEYRRVAPHVRIRITTTPIDAYQTVMRTRLASGRAPDLLTIWPGNGNSMSAAQIAPLGVLADLSDTAYGRSVPAAARPLLGTDGRVRLWTPGSNVVGALYNRAVFRRAGVTVPRTWGELLAACDRLRQAGVAPIAVGNQTPWVAQLIDYALAPTHAYARDPHLDRELRAGRTTFARSGWREALTRYVELSRRGCYQADPNGTSLERAEAMVARGEAAMTVLVGPAHTSLHALNPEGEFGIFPFPAADRAEDLRVAAGIASGLGVNARSPRLPEALRFVEFLARPENTRRFNAEAQNLALDGSSGAAFLEPFVPYVRAGRTVPFPDQLWPNADTQREHIAVAQDLLAGRETIDGGLRRMDRAYALR